MFWGEYYVQLMRMHWPAGSNSTRQCIERVALAHRLDPYLRMHQAARLKMSTDQWKKRFKAQDIFDECPGDGVPGSQKEYLHSLVQAVDVTAYEDVLLNTVLHRCVHVYSLIHNTIIHMYIHNYP
jgi:hypothetical protein